MNVQNITLHNPPELAFGFGTLEYFFKDYLNTGLGRLYIVTIPALRNWLDPYLEQLTRCGIMTAVNERVVAEPTFGLFDEILESARRFGADSVVGIGGGSVLDTAKLLAAMLLNEQEIRSVIGTRLLKERKTWLACIPTTSGTGSEVSPNAIFLDQTDHEKKGVISPFLVPDAAYIDPELILGVPSSVTAYTGIDAFTHCLEAFVNRFAHPFTDGLALEGMRLIFQHLKRACDNGQDREARAALALGSLYGGMCLGPVNTAAVHALAYPLGSRYKIAHGLSNALLLPYVMEFNLPAATDRFAQMAKALGLTGLRSEQEQAEAGLLEIKDWLRSIGIPDRMSVTGIPESDLEEMASSALKVRRLLKNNVREVRFEDALEIYRKAY